MMFNVPDSQHNFYLTLIASANYEKIKELDKNKNVVILNPDLIIDSFHIKLGVNNAIYKINSGKTRTKMLKNAIIHYLTVDNKLENSLKLHQITKKDKNFYIIFIDFSKEDIDKEINNLEGNIISPENYNKFKNEEEIKKKFKITDIEINNIENGLERAVYNKLSIKDLK